MKEEERKELEEAERKREKANLDRSASYGDSDDRTVLSSKSNINHSKERGLQRVESYNPDMHISSAIGDTSCVTFKVEIKNLKATDLKCRHRFKEKLRVRLFFDDRKFKTDKELVGGGDVTWKNHFSFEWTQNADNTSSFVMDFVKNQLESKSLKIQVFCQHDERTNKQPLGTCTVDFYTMATGPVDHNLPLFDAEKATVGRMNFSVEMVQISDVVVTLKEIHVKNLHSEEDDLFSINPYLKYAYSKDWPAIIDGRMRATYSETIHRNPSPNYEERQLPLLKFRASLNELVKESLVMHVTHKGKITNTTLGRCNLLFRTLVDGGKSFKEEDLISFKGPLNKKDSGTTIEGRLVFKHLPVFAQMKALSGGRMAVHNEKGIFDAMPLLTWVPKPILPVIHSDTPSAEVGTPKTARKSASRSKADRKSQDLSGKDKDKENFKDEKSEKKEKLVQSESAVGKKAKSPEKSLREKMFHSTGISGDLINFTPPSARKRSTSDAPLPQDFPQPNFNFDDDTFIGKRDPVLHHSNEFTFGQQSFGGNTLSVQHHNSNQSFNNSNNSLPTFQPQTQQQQPMYQHQNSFTSNSMPQYNSFNSQPQQQSFGQYQQQPQQQQQQQQSQSSFNPFAPSNLQQQQPQQQQPIQTQQQQQ